MDDREIGYERSTSWPRRLVRRIGFLSIPLYATVLFILIVVSVVSVSVALFDIKDDHNVQETDLQLPSLPIAELRPGWQLFNLSEPSDRVFDYKERPTLTQSFFSPGCADAWIATGALCDEITHRAIPRNLQDSMKMSTVHAWVNGSDTQIALWKEAVIQNGSGITLNGWKRPVGNMARHFRCSCLPVPSPSYILICFRTHGELLYSMRSVVRSFHPNELDKLHLVTTDLPFDRIPNTRLGQLPTWFREDEPCTPRIELHHHWELFRQHRPIKADEDEWKASILPTFNSIGIEAQLVSLAPKMGDIFIYVRS